MELEKQIYKFHYFLTSWKYARVSAKILFLGLLGISLLFIGVYVSLCVRQGERRLEFLQQDNSVISQFNESVVYTVNIVDHSFSNPLLQMKFSFNKYLLTLRQNIAKDHNITQEILFVDSNNYQSNFDLFFLNFVDIETMFLVDFTNYFTDSENDILIQNLKTRELWYWGRNSLKNDESTSFYIKMIRNIFLCQQILVTIFFVSCTSSIIIRLFLLSVPAFSYIIRSLLQLIFRQEQELNNQGNQENWIGIYIRLLERNNKVKYYIIFAFLTMIFFYTVIYNQGLDQATQFMFGKSIPLGLNIYFMIIVFINELQGVLFLRTRSSIYFVPKYICCYYITYLYYLEQTSLTIVFLMSLSTFAAFLYFFEVPALTWQRASFYTPTEQRPRCYSGIDLNSMKQLQTDCTICHYFKLNGLVISLKFGLYSTDFVDESTLKGIMTFVESELQHLAYVDRNQIQFHQILEDDEHIDL